jgi:hypothetical protein
VTALAFDAQGHLLAGTESPGRVLRIGADGRAFVLLDSPYREIRRLRLDSRGNIYAVAVSGREPETRGPDRQPPEPPPTTTVTPSVSTEITITAIGDVAVPSTSGVTPRPESRKENKGAVYRIAPDGLWDIAWESTEDSPYDVAFDESEALLIATGPQGKIFRVTGEPARTTLLARAAAKQVTTLVRGREGALFSLASNPGKVYRLSSEPAERGVYESDVRDAGTVATWGAIRWHATTPPGSSVEISTRAGNTGRPDETWSDWSPGYRTATGEPIASPKARYLQWRAVLAAGKGASPVLTSVTAAYLPRNIRPEVDGITVHPPGTVFQRPFSTGEAELAGYDGNTSDGRPITPASSSLSALSGPAPALGRRAYQKGLQTFVWKASDANDDKLQYDVFYRREGDITWRPLKPGLWDEILTWDTTSVPDGTYTIKVVASDAPSNAPATALSGELESISFDIDNTPPDIAFTGTPGSSRRVTFTVRDEQSVIQRVEYSLDASRWRVVYPVDGLADSRVETFEIALPPDADPNNVIVRATDALNNVATAVVRPTR